MIYKGDIRLAIILTFHVIFRIQIATPQKWGSYLQTLSRFVNGYITSREFYT
jgi:hypothetical protein